MALAGGLTRLCTPLDRRGCSWGDRAPFPHPNPADGPEHGPSPTSMQMDQCLLPLPVPSLTSPSVPQAFLQGQVGGRSTPQAQQQGGGRTPTCVGLEDLPQPRVPLALRYACCTHRFASVMETGPFYGSDRGLGGERNSQEASPERASPFLLLWGHQCRLFPCTEANARSETAKTPPSETTTWRPSGTFQDTGNSRWGQVSPNPSSKTT